MKLIKVIKKIVLAAAVVFLLLPNYGCAQLINNGALITVTNGSILFTDATFTNTANGTFTNNGQVITNGSIINNAGSSLSGNGSYNVQGDFTNKGSFSEENSILNFFGDNNSSLKNADGNIYTLQVNKYAGRYLIMLDNEKVLNKVIFTTDKNWVRLDDNTLTLDINGSVAGYNNKRYFITNGTGVLKKKNVNNSAFTFPVGFNKSTYNPLTITEKGTADDYSVQCLEHALLDGPTGAPITTDGIDAGWMVNEGTAGGANATIKAEWKNTDDLAGFNYYACMLARYTGSKWDFNHSLADSAKGTTYKSISRGALSSFGYFTVLSSKDPTFTNNISLPQNNSFATAENNNTQFKIYPTVVQNNINIVVPSVNTFNTKMNISIIDGNGKTVWQKQNADFQSQQILLPDLATGIYHVFIRYDKNMFDQKIIVSR